MGCSLPVPEPMDQPLRLPSNASTATAAELQAELVRAIDGEAGIAIDASQVESIGQAALQILVAARAEAQANDRLFRIVDPSAAFVDRVTRCRLAAAIGLETGDAL